MKRETRGISKISYFNRKVTMARTNFQWFFVNLDQINLAVLGATELHERKNIFRNRERCEKESILCMIYFEAANLTKSTLIPINPLRSTVPCEGNSHT